MNKEELEELMKENKHLNDLLDGALKEKEEAEIKIDKAIEYIKENCSNYYVEKPNYRGVELINIEELLDILGDKENE